MDRAAALRIAGSLFIVAGITFVYRTMILVNSTTTALTLLLAILGVATQWGLTEAIIASVAGMLCSISFSSLRWERSRLRIRRTGWRFSRFW